MPNYAVIDLGSNSVRLVVYEVDSNKKRSYTNKDFRSLINDKVMAGLAAYVEDGVFTDAGIKRAITILKGHLKRSRYFECKRIDCFATAVLRNASNCNEAIAAIASETQSMKELVENRLFLARHDKKTLSLSFAPFDSAEMLRELVKETEIIAVNHRVIGGTLAECTLLGDRAMVKQAVRIFVDNALKYTPPGGCVEIASRRLAQSLLITVSDNGPGIKKADLLRIFDRFYRADAARSGQVAGHGLGLSIARTIALSHNGKIHVKSKPGQGSAFSLELPAPPV